MTANQDTNSRGGSCEVHEPRLSAYILDELSGDERREVDAHLALCGACRDDLALLSQTADALRASPPVEGAIAPERRQALLAAAREETLAKPARKGPWGPAYGLLGLAAAAVVVVSFVGVRMHRTEVESRVPGETELAAVRAPAPAGPVSAGSAAAGEPVDTRNFVNMSDTLALKQDKRVEDLAAKVDGFGAFGTTPPSGDARGSVEIEKLYTWNAVKDSGLGLGNVPAEAPAPEARRFVVTVTPPGATREARLVQDSGGREASGAEAARPEADSLFYKRVARSGEPAAPAPDRYSVDAAASPETAGQGGGEGVVKLDLATRAEAPELALRGLERNGQRALEESLDRKRKQPGVAGGEPLVDGIELTRQGLEHVHEFAPGLDPVRLEKEQSGAPADPAAAAPAAPTELAAGKPGAAPAGKAAGASAPAGPAPLSEEQRGAVAASPAAGASLSTAAPADRPDAWKVRVDEFLSRLDRRPGETPDMMFFRFWGDNSFVETSSDRLSTFGVDVDTASYTLFRAYLYKQGILPPAEAVRTEEFVNYFRSRHAPPPADGPAFAIHADLAPSPFAHEPDYRLLQVGLKGREVPREKRKAAALVFVIDTSGSMRRENRLELVKDALRLLVRELDEGDTIGIVAFDREARTILEPCPGSDAERILSAIATLEPRQNTNVAAGLQLGYGMAAARKIADGSNRVILLSDGVANTGVTDPDAMLEMVRAQREQGIFLTCAGVGMGNLNDALLERLADRGNGQCVYVDRIEEARKVFVENLVGTLETIAKDVKIQVEFDPARVIRYRLLGYENRNIADADFRNNQVDAGEVGAGHEVAALYELKMKPDAAPEDAKAVAATIRVRYLTPEHGEAVELKREVTTGEAKASFTDAPARFQVAACAAELAEVLRESYWARGSSLAKVAGMVETILPAPDGAGKLGDDADVVELAALLRKADALVREREARLGEVARTAEALKENAWLRSRIEDRLQARREENRAQLDEILRQNQELRQRLEELLRG